MKPITFVPITPEIFKCPDCDFTATTSFAVLDHLLSIARIKYFVTSSHLYDQHFNKPIQPA
jgi:hypothetical protein